MWWQLDSCRAWSFFRGLRGRTHTHEQQHSVSDRLICYHTTVFVKIHSLWKTWSQSTFSSNVFSDITCTFLISLVIFNSRSEWLHTFSRVLGNKMLGASLFLEAAAYDSMRSVLIGTNWIKMQALRWWHYVDMGSLAAPWTLGIHVECSLVLLFNSVVFITTS